MSWSLLLPALPLLAFAAWRDIATRTIPDWVSLTLAALGLALRAAEGWQALAASLAAAAILFLLLFICHARGILGGGDVKLLTALALGLPPLGSWNLVVATALAGGVWACLYLVLHRLLAVAPMRSSALAGHRSGPLRRVVAIETWRVRRRGPMPYGVPIALGGALVLLQQFQGS